MSPFHGRCSPALLSAPEEKSEAFIQSGLNNKVAGSWQNATPHSSKSLSYLNWIVVEILFWFF